MRANAEVRDFLSDIFESAPTFLLLVKREIARLSVAPGNDNVGAGTRQC